MQICQVGCVVGASSGWAVAGLLAVWDGTIPPGRVVPLMLIALSVALFCSASIAFRRQQAPLGMAFELGYSAGRKDAIREASKRVPSVTPIRRVPNGLGAFNRDKVLS